MRASRSVSFLAIGALVALLAVIAPGCSLSVTRFTPPEEPPPDTAALTAAQPSYDFGTIIIGEPSAPASMMFTNTGTAATGELAPAMLSGPGAVLFTVGSDGCAHRVLAPGDSCMVAARLAPSSAGLGQASLVVGGSPGGAAMVSLVGTVVERGALRIDPPAAAYGSLAPGATSPDTVFTIRNTGGASSGLMAVKLSGSDATQFATALDHCSGAILASGGSCTVVARFAPTTPGARAASLTIDSAAAGTAVATLGGNGLAPAALAVAPAMADLGPVVTGAASAGLTLTVTNTGQLPSGAIAVAETGDAGQFQRQSDGCTGTTLAPATSCNITMVFAPTAPTRAAVLVTASASPGGSATAALAGTGIPPAALVWTPTSNDYGQVDVGAMSTPATFTLQNTGGQTTSAIAASLRGASPGDYAILTDTCSGQRLAPAASCSVTVVFAPTVYGVRGATLAADASIGGTTTSSLTGTARDKLTLTVLTSGGTGSGTVMPSIGLLTCTGATCTARYYRGTQLTLTAVPDAGNLFSAWSGPCTASGVCSIVLDANLTVTAAFVPATQDLRLATTGLGGAAGAIDVAASPSGTSCGTGCLRFPSGTRVTLTARPTSGYLSTWAGDCVGNGLGCVLDMTTNHAATATFAPGNLVFVTSGRFVPSPNNPVAWADGVCQGAAQAAGLSGTFIGWISNGAANWATRLGNASGWVRLDGKPFATTKAELLSGHSLYPNRVDEHGVAVPASTLVLSGLGPDDYSCTGWTQTSGGRQMPGQAGGGWAQAAIYDFYDFDQNQSAVTCGTPMPLHCFQVDYNVNLTYPRATGRTMFFARQTSNGPNGGGIAALDRLCSDKAMAAGLPGSFRALVATTAGSAASRFTTSGQPWVRADGIPLVAQAADLFAAGGPQLLTSLDVDEHGAGVYGFALAGAPDLVTPGTAATTCSDYTDGTSLDRSVIVGYGSFGNHVAFGYGLDQCAYGAGLYCLQQ